MASRSGPFKTLRESAVFAATGTWYACTDVIKMGSAANSLLLYVQSATASPGNVDFYISHSTDDDGTGAVGTFYTLSVGDETPEVYGPIAFGAAGESRSLRIPALPPLETVKVYFRASANATSAKIAIKALSYLDESGTANAEISVGDIEVEIESVTEAEDAALESAQPGIVQTVKAADFDGSALTTGAVGTEGDAVIPKASLYGVGYSMPVTEDGGATPLVAHDAAITAAAGGTVGFMAAAESKTVDGAALPNSVTEGDAVRPAASIAGVGLQTLANQAGTGTAVALHDGAIGTGEGTAVVISGGMVQTIDGSALPNAADTEADACHFAVSASGVQYGIVTNVGGTQTAVIDIDAAPATGIGGAVVMAGATAKDFDGAAIPAAAGTEGDAAAIAVTLSGVVMTMPVSEDGSEKPYIQHAAAIDAAAGGTIGQPLFAEYEAIGALDSTGVAAGDATRLKASADGRLYTQHTDGSYATPAGDAVTRAIHTAVGDATTTAVVETAGTKKALNVNVTDGTNDMPTMDAAARAGFVEITDGTDTVDVIDVGAANTGLPVGHFDAEGNRTPAMDAAARKGFVAITDGTDTVDVIDVGAANTGLPVGHFDAEGNRTPAMDASARAGFVKLTDGTDDAAVVDEADDISTDDNGVIIYGKERAGNTAQTLEFNTTDDLYVDINAMSVGVLDIQGDDVHGEAFDANPVGIGAEYEALGSLDSTGIAAGDITRLKSSADGRLYVQPTDGTNSQAMMDSNARPGFVKITDGADEVDVIVQDAAFGTGSKGFPLFGKYEATPTTYTDGDAVPVALDSNGRVKLSDVDIEIGAVELKNAASDDRALISDANTARGATDHVISVQQLAADGTVPPSGSLVSNAPFVKITDATNTAAVGTGTTKVLLAGVHDGELLAAVKANSALADDLDGVNGLVTASVVHGYVDNDTTHPVLVDSSGHVQVDVASLPGSLVGYAEDAAHVNGDIGVQVLSVRADIPAATSGTSGDYQPLLTDEHGCLHVSPQTSAVVDACDATAGWSVISDDTANLTTSTNHTYGTVSLSFDKVNGTANTIYSGIQKTISAIDCNRYIDHARGFFLGSMYVSSLANVAYAWFRAGTDNANYNEWRVDDDNLTAGEWMALRGNLGAPFVSVGNGWNSAAVTYIAIGLAHDTETDTLSGILVDGLFVNAGLQVTADISATAQINTPNINLHRVGGTPTTTGTGNVGSGTQRVTLADNDTNAAAIKTAVELIDDAVGTDGAAGPTKCISIGGTDGGTGNIQEISVTSDGAVNVVEASAATIAGDTTSIDGKTPALGTAAMAASSPITIATDDTMFTALDTALDVVAGDTTSIDGKTPALGTAAMAASSPVTIATDDTMFTALDTAVDSVVTAVQIMDDWDESDRCKVNIIAGQAGIAAGAQAMGVTVPCVTIATDDTHFGSVGAASDIDGVLHGQIRYANDYLTTIDTDTGNIATNTTDLPNVIGTDGAAGPSKCLSVGGTDGSGNIQEISTDTSGYVNIVHQSSIAGGCTPYKNLDVDESEDQVKATAATLYSIYAINLAATKRYLKLYNDTAANVVVGTTVPDLTFAIPTLGDTNGCGFTLNFTPGFAFSTALTVAATTGFADNDSGAPGANEVLICLGYK